MLLPEHGPATRGCPPTYRPPTPLDGSGVWALASRNGLDENSPYAYLLWGTHFAATSVVADDGEGIVGFVNGYRVPDRPDTLFVWQVAVDERQRGTGIASRMLLELMRRTPSPRFVEATVNPGNDASAALFRRLGARLGANVEESLLFDEALFPGNEHEAEVLFRIGPVTEPTT